MYPKAHSDPAEIAAYESNRITLQEFSEAFGESFGSLVSDSFGRVLSVSRSFATMVGREQRQLIGTRLSDLFTTSPNEARRPAYPERIPASGLYTLRHRDGHLRRVQLWCRPVLTSTPQPRVACLVRRLGTGGVGLANEAKEEKSVARAMLDQLTEREWTVLKNIAQGLPNRVTAKHLAVSQRTIESDRSSIQKKIGAKSLAEMLRVYLIAQAQLHPDDPPEASHK